MNAKSETIKSNLAKVDSHQNTAEDYAEIPELPDDFFEQGEVFRNGRRVRGPQKTPKKIHLNLRLSSEVVAHYKATGKGWQTRIDEALKKLIQ